MQALRIENDNDYYIPRYELFVRTQNIFNGSTIASAWIGVMSTSHHSNIVAQYHHNRIKLSISAMDIIASTATENDDVNNGSVAPLRIGSLFLVVVVVVVFIIIVATVFAFESMKNNGMGAFIPLMHIINSL